MGDGDPVIDREANMEEDGSIPRAIDGARLCQRHHKRSFDYSEYGRTGLSGGGNALGAAVTMLSAEDESYVQKRVHQLEENCRIALETSQSKVHRVDALFAASWILGFFFNRGCPACLAPTIGDMSLRGRGCCLTAARIVH